MKTSDRLIKLARKQGAPDVRAETIGATLTSESTGDEELYLPVTDCRYILICSDYLVQNGQSLLKSGKYGT